MKVSIGIDCTMRWTSVGLVQSGEVACEFNCNLGRAQSERLPLMVDRLLALNGVAFKELSHIAVTVGPGYYTGIRVGLAYACALAQALQIPVAPVISLYAFIRDLIVLPGACIPVLRARQGQYYAAVYSGETHLCIPPTVVSEEELGSWVSRQPSSLLVGKDAQFLSATRGYRCLPRTFIRGGEVALAGEELEELLPAEQVRGMYLRAPDIGTAASG